MLIRWNETVIGFIKEVLPDKDKLNITVEIYCDPEEAVIGASTIVLPNLHRRTPLSDRVIRGVIGRRACLPPARALTSYRRTTVRPLQE